MKLSSPRLFFKHLERSYKQRVLKPLRFRLRHELASIYRSLLGLSGRVCFIGVTGSCGKTTTTELIAAVLSRHGRTFKCSHLNTSETVAKTILRVAPRRQFCVQELSAHGPGAMAKSAKLFRPKIGVVTNIGQDHYSSYRTLEATAAEKGKLVEVLPADGTAVLNADDPHVLAMRSRTRARVITYGLAAEAMVRGEGVSCVWPTPMSLDVRCAGQRLHARTRLLGEHWAGAVLAAIATGIAAGVSLEQAVAAVEAFEPMPYRMCPHRTPEGVTFISDNWKNPLWAMDAPLDFLRKAKAGAGRKILIVGSVSDTPKSFFRRHRAIIKLAADIVDRILFVGDNAYSALRSRAHPEDQQIMAFSTIRQIDRFLTEYLRAGDLVLLKGTDRTDHLQRLVLSRTDHVACWKEKCEKTRLCSECRLLHTPTEPPADRVRVRPAKPPRPSS